MPKAVKEPKAPKEKKVKVPKVILPPFEDWLNRFTQRTIGRSNPPPLDVLFQGKIGKKIKIKDIAVFEDEPDCPVLGHLWAEGMDKINTLHVQAPVDMDNVEKVGESIIAAEALLTPIHIATIKDNPDFYQCISGRHRLTFFALMYGTDAEVTCYVEEGIDHSIALMSVPEANNCRKTSTTEKAAHLVILNGYSPKGRMNEEETYKALCINKSRFILWAIDKMVNERDGKTFKGKMKVGDRSNDEMSTAVFATGISSLCSWQKGTTYDQAVKMYDASISVMNNYYSYLKKVGVFNKVTHYHSKPYAGLMNYIAQSRANGHTVDYSKLMAYVVHLGESYKVQKVKEISNDLCYILPLVKKLDDGSYEFPTVTKDA